MLEWARGEAAQTVEHVDARSERALLPRFYLQLGNTLWTRANAADQL